MDLNPFRMQYKNLLSQSTTIEPKPADIVMSYLGLNTSNLDNKPDQKWQNLDIKSDHEAKRGTVEVKDNPKKEMEELHIFAQSLDKNINKSTTQGFVLFTASTDIQTKLNHLLKMFKDKEDADMTIVNIVKENILDIINSYKNIITKSHTAQLRLQEILGIDNDKILSLDNLQFSDIQNGIKLSIAAKNRSVIAT